MKVNDQLLDLVESKDYFRFQNSTLCIRPFKSDKENDVIWSKNIASFHDLLKDRIIFAERQSVHL